MFIYVRVLQPLMQACAKCDSEIVQEASECPECGNNPGKSAFWSGIVMSLIGVVTLPIFVGFVLLPIGLAMIWAGKRKFTPVEQGWG